MLNSDITLYFNKRKLNLTWAVIIFVLLSLFSSSEATMSAIEDGGLRKVKSGDAAQSISHADMEVISDGKNDLSEAMIEIGNIRKKKNYDDFLQYLMLIFKESKDDDFKNSLESDAFLLFSRKFASLANGCLKEILSIEYSTQNHEMNSFFRAQKRLFGQPINFYDKLMKYRKNGITFEAIVKLIEDLEQDYHASENEYHNLMIRYSEKNKERP